MTVENKKKEDVKGTANPDDQKMQIMDDQANSYEPNLQENTNFLSRIFFVYTRKIMQKGAKLEKENKYLTDKDLFDCKKEINPITQQKQIINSIFNPSVKSKIPVDKQSESQKLYTYIIKLILRRDYIVTGLMGTFGNLMQFSGPIFLKLILEYLEDKDEKEYRGYVWASVIFVCFFMKIFLTQNCLDIVNDFSIKLLNGTSGALLEKIFRISSASKKYFETGKVMNFVTVDQQMVFQMAQVSAMLFSSPIMIIVAMILICLDLGWIGLLTPVFFVLIFALQSRLQIMIEKMRYDIMKWKDKRAKAVNEYFNGIRIVKYYAWENVVKQQVQTMRKEESKTLLKLSRIRTTIEETSNFTPVLVAICIFIIYSAAGNELKPSKAYTILALFNLLMLPFRMMIFTLMMYIGTKASLGRINHFLDAGERSTASLVENNELENGKILIQQGTFAWETVDALKHHLQDPRLAQKKKGNNKTQKVQKEEPNLKEEQIKALQKKNLNILENINFEAKKGELVGVIGSVASGKTSFLHALLGEMEKIEGKVEKNGSIAYVSQTAWLQNDSLKNNILFGSPYDQKKYDKVVELCELKADIEILPGGDQVEIGERGVNLSGGQKQRIAIARAVYADADIYLIDDCLSALDAHVGKNIFNNVLKNLLKDKTIIFVTHALQYMPQTNRIIVFSKGQIAEQGTYEELSKNENGEFVKLTVQFKKQQEEEEEDEVKEESYKDLEAPDEREYTKKDMEEEIHQQQELEMSRKNSMASSGRRKSRSLSKDFSHRESQLKLKKEQEIKQKAVGALVQKEERAVGSVPWRIYANYLSAGGKFTTFMVFSSLIFAQALRIANDWWLGQWSNDSFNLSNGQYIGIYAGIGCTAAVFYFVRGQVYAKFTVICADKFQEQLMDKLLHTPMWWFDITPTGRIITRTTKDQDDIDTQLPFSLSVALQYTLLLVSTIILIGVILPIFFAVSIIGLYVFAKIIQYYLISAREIKRIESNARSPVISNFQEAINGTYIIRAFKKEQFYVDKYIRLQHRFVVGVTNYNYTQRWISVMTDLFALIIIGSTCYFAVLSRNYNYVDNSALMGLAISYSFQITIILSFTLKMIADTESQMNAIVRMLQYIEGNPEEKTWNVLEEEKKQKQKKENEVKNDEETQISEWPTKGNFELNKVTYKYRPELPEVIHGISFKIMPFEKVGIVGRTGSGKSTMTLGLLRILEMAQGGDGTLGNIVLDDKDIAKVGLHDLREKVTIIPQDPILFTGSIRFNVDPFNKYSREKLINAMKQVQIWDQIQEMIEKQEQKQNQQQQSKSVNPENPSQLHAANLSKIEKEDLILNWQVDDGGENFSLGQRQLLCMARALIREPKVLLMDEATASIDEKTDHLIQKMIKNVFRNTTVITIAHRINTIMQYDKIVVLERGDIIEIDTPLNLIKKDNGLFASLVNEGGPEFKEKMIYMAQHKDSDLDEME